MGQKQISLTIVVKLFPVLSTQNADTRKFYSILNSSTLFLHNLYGAGVELTEEGNSVKGYTKKVSFLVCVLPQ